MEVHQVLLALSAIALLTIAEAGRPVTDGLIEQVTDGAELGREPIFQQSLVDAVNAHPAATWTAGENKRLEGFTRAEFQVLLGSKTANPFEPQLPNKPLKRWHPHHWRPHIRPMRHELPKNFDAREQWPQCPSLNQIRDQGHCGSCWAFGAVETLSDRFCIAGHENATLSANDLLSCCGFECGDGCNGGYPERAWEYFKRSGVVTTQCDPYFDQKGCKHPGCEPAYPTPKCVKHCVDDELWDEVKHHSQGVYAVGPEVEDLKQELYKNGPIEVAFTVYEDFAHYKHGVYQHLFGEVMGGHAVKLIGWGTTDKGVDYWLIANSWNRSWGEDGFFRILRGKDECGIESNAVTGLPAIKKHK